MDGHGTPPAVSERWEDFMADLEATAEEYREDGYEVLPIHSADVVPVAKDLALDVLAPGDEFEQLEALVADVEVDTYSVFDAQEGGVTFALVVAEDTDAEVAVPIPVFFYENVREGLGTMASEAGRLDIQVRPLSDESRVVFTIEEPAILFSEPSDSQE
jgi:hypothetical protein